MHVLTRGNVTRARKHEDEVADFIKDTLLPVSKSIYANTHRTCIFIILAISRLLDSNFLFFVLLSVQKIHTLE